MVLPSSSALSALAAHRRQQQVEAAAHRGFQSNKKSSNCEFEVLGPEYRKQPWPSSALPAATGLGEASALGSQQQQSHNIISSSRSGRRVATAAAAFGTASSPLAQQGWGSLSTSQGARQPVPRPKAKRQAAKQASGTQTEGGDDERADDRVEGFSTSNAWHGQKQQQQQAQQLRGDKVAWVGPQDTTGRVQQQISHLPHPLHKQHQSDQHHWQQQPDPHPNQQPRSSGLQSSPSHFHNSQTLTPSSPAAAQSWSTTPPAPPSRIRPSSAPAPPGQAVPSSPVTLAPSQAASLVPHARLAAAGSPTPHLVACQPPGLSAAAEPRNSRAAAGPAAMAAYPPCPALGHVGAGTGMQQPSSGSSAPAPGLTAESRRSCRPQGRDAGRDDQGRATAQPPPAAPAAGAPGVAAQGSTPRSAPGPPALRTTATAGFFSPVRSAWPSAHAHAHARLGAHGALPSPAALLEITSVDDQHGELPHESRQQSPPHSTARDPRKQRQQQHQVSQPLTAPASPPATLHTLTRNVVHVAFGSTQLSQALARKGMPLLGWSGTTQLVGASHTAALHDPGPPFDQQHLAPPQPLQHWRSREEEEEEARRRNIRRRHRKQVARIVVDHWKWFARDRLKVSAQCHGC